MFKYGDSVIYIGEDKIDSNGNKLEKGKVYTVCGRYDGAVFLEFVYNSVHPLELRLAEGKRPKTPDNTHQVKPGDEVVCVVDTGGYLYTPGERSIVQSVHHESGGLFLGLNDDTGGVPASYFEVLPPYPTTPEPPEGTFRVGDEVEYIRPNMQSKRGTLGTGCTYVVEAVLNGGRCLRVAGNNFNVPAREFKLLKKKNKTLESAYDDGSGVEFLEPLESEKNDPVNHPAHYTNHPSGVECIQITEHMGFNLGNAVKYIWRADLKHDCPLEDLHKAKFYIEREIAKRTKVYDDFEKYKEENTQRWADLKWKHAQRQEFSKALFQKEDNKGD